MRQVYVRFVAAGIDEDSGRRRGVFQAAYDLINRNELPAQDLVQLRGLLKWFSEHLEIPDRFSRSRRSGAARKAISWYKSTATEYVSRMHSICRILNEHEVQTEMITSERPGYVVFEDEHQVAAVPFAETET